MRTIQCVNLFLLVDVYNYTAYYKIETKINYYRLRPYFFAILQPEAQGIFLGVTGIRA